MRHEISLCQLCKGAICVLMNQLIYISVTSCSPSSQRKYLEHLNSDLRNESLETLQLHFLLRILLQDNLTYCVYVNNTFIVNLTVCLWDRQEFSFMYSGWLTILSKAKSLLPRVRVAKRSFITIWSVHWLPRKICNNVEQSLKEVDVIFFLIDILCK